jgi:hypothetical protein
MNTRLHARRWLIWFVAVLCFGALEQTALAQQANKVWHIGLCHVGLDHEPPGLNSLHQALNDMGYVDGRNLRFDWRNQADAPLRRRPSKSGSTPMST